MKCHNHFFEYEKVGNESKKFNVLGVKMLVFQTGDDTTMHVLYFHFSYESTFSCTSMCERRIALGWDRKIVRERDELLYNVLIRRNDWTLRNWCTPFHLNMIVQQTNVYTLRPSIFLSFFLDLSLFFFFSFWIFSYLLF